MITLAVYVGSDLFWAVAGSCLRPGHQPIGLATFAPKPFRERSPLESYALIHKRNLFGGTVDSALRDSLPLPLPSTDSAPLWLRLAGTVVGRVRGDESTYAIIEVLPARKQDLYRVDGRVQGVTVAEIARHRVVLGSRDRLEERRSFHGVEEAAPMVEAIVSGGRALGPVPKDVLGPPTHASPAAGAERRGAD